MTAESQRRSGSTCAAVRASVRQWSLFVLAIGLVGVACDGGAGQRTTTPGAIALTLSVPDAVVTTVHYDVSGGGFSRSGDIGVTAPGSTATVFLGGVPAGVGYVVALSAMTSDAGTTCGGSARADVRGDATTPVSVALTCRRAPTVGNVVGTATFNLCPLLTSLVATPAMVSVGQQETIDLTAGATDADRDPLAFLWSAGAGTFADTTTAHARYHCAAPGPVAVTVVVSDGQCNDSVTATLVCLPFCAGKTNGTTCSDQDACTQTDHCLDGRCVGTAPIVCAVTDPCHLPGLCDPASGGCTNPNAPDWTVCDDGNACLQDDRCFGGQCVGGMPVICAPLDQCHSAGTCAPEIGTCSIQPRPDGDTCQLPNAVSACRAGTCGIVACAAGTRDCNTIAADGCETSVTTNLDCGTCGHACLGGSQCTAGLCLIPPPVGLVAVAGGWRVALAWNARPGAASYEVLRRASTSSSAPFESVGATEGTTLVDQAVVSGTTYTYAVRASSAEGVGALSALTTATPLPKQVCVSSNASQAVLGFEATQQGTATPVRTLGGVGTAFGFPTAVTASLSTGELFVAKRGGRTDVYPLAANGNPLPARSLLSPVPVGISWTVAVDDVTGQVVTADYRATNLGGRLIAVDGLGGALTRLVSGASTLLGFPASLVIDRSHAEVFVGVTGDADPTLRFPRVLSFPANGGGDIPPLRVLGAVANPDVGAWDIAYDRARDQLLTTCNCDNRITIFSRTAEGNAAPVRTLVLPPTVLSLFALLLDDAADTVWVLARTAADLYSLMEIPVAANGSVSPLRPPIELATAGRLARCN